MQVGEGIHLPNNYNKAHHSAIIQLTQTNEHKKTMVYILFTLCIPDQ